MELDRDQLQKDIHALYEREHKELGDAGTAEHLDRATEFKLGNTLSSGGVLVFPHAGVHDCGYQIAVCVQAALDSGADRVLVVSVLHAFTEEMEQARRRVAAGGDVTQEALWGIQGPGLDGRQEWRGDHALYSWRWFWDAEVKRRGLRDSQIPEVIERYPYLAGGKPEILPGIEELQEIAKDAVIVSTADAFHHGIGYGTPPEEAMEPDEAGLAAAQAKIQEGLDILSTGDYWGFNQHCVEAKSDARDAGQVYRYIRGAMSGKVIDMSYTDSTELYGTPKPTWVAGAIMEWHLDS
ncbi:MAG: hypothetical protein AAFQ52_03965 [Chloroflexota bacterium]